MQTTQMPALSIVVWANIIDVNRYLADIVNIAQCLPDLTKVAHLRQPDEVMVISREFGAARTRCSIEHIPGRTEWHIEEPVGYTGTILAFGDSSISRLRSTLQQDVSDRAGRALLHMRFLRELADRIESGRQQPAVRRSQLQHSRSA